MTTIITLKGADFRGRGLPNLRPFVDQRNAHFAFDFRGQSIVDQAGKRVLTPTKVSGGARTVDPSIVVPTADGLGARLELGCLVMDMASWTVPIDGSMQFTVMVAGGYSGVPFPSSEVIGSAPTTTLLIDFGSHIGNNALSLRSELTTTSGQYRQAAQIAASTPALAALAPLPTAKTVRFLTFDGANWRLENKTLGHVQAKTNAEIPVSGVITPSESQPNVVMGNYRSNTTVGAAFPDLYQVAAWPRVLTAEEIADQYARTKAAFPGVGF